MNHCFNHRCVIHFLIINQGYLLVKMVHSSRMFLLLGQVFCQFTSYMISMCGAPVLYNYSAITI